MPPVTTKSRMRSTVFHADSLGAHPIAGKWSAREIVHHLGDSETTSAWRLRRLLVEDNPLIQGYDQDQFATRLHYNERDMAPALEAFRCARESTMQLLGIMTEDDWKRAGTHSESGALHNGRLVNDLRKARTQPRSTNSTTARSSQYLNQPLS